LFTKSDIDRLSEDEVLKLAIGVRVNRLMFEDAFTLFQVMFEVIGLAVKTSSFGDSLALCSVVFTMWSLEGSVGRFNPKLPGSIPVHVWFISP
jgi:hypothetical protein